MAEPIRFPGTVEWTGENPAIYLKERPDGPFTTMASFFRVMLSPHGRGHVLVLLQSPQEADPPPERANLCLHDNEPLARYLVGDFVRHFGNFRGVPGLDRLDYRKLDSVSSSGDARSSFGQTLRAGALTVELRWAGLGEPFCFVLPPEKSATGPEELGALLEELARSSPARSQSGTRAIGPRLSPRELEVVVLVASGKSNREVADSLAISVRTVETHRARVMQKLGLQGAASLTLWAVNRGLVRP